MTQTPSVNILLLDIDGVLKSLQGAGGTIAGTDWKEGVHEFVIWCQNTFHVVLVLSSWQADIHAEFETVGLQVPALSWKSTKTEGLSGLCGPEKHIVWVEDGWDEDDRQKATDLGINLVETQFNESLELTKKKIEAVSVADKQQR